MYEVDNESGPHHKTCIQSWKLKDEEKINNIQVKWQSYVDQYDRKLINVDIHIIGIMIRWHRMLKLTWYMIGTLKYLKIKTKT